MIKTMANTQSGNHFAEIDAVLDVYLENYEGIQFHDFEKNLFRRALHQGMDVEAVIANFLANNRDLAKTQKKVFGTDPKPGRQQRRRGFALSAEFKFKENTPPDVSSNYAYHNGHWVETIEYQLEEHPMKVDFHYMSLDRALDDLQLVIDHHVAAQTKKAVEIVTGRGIHSKDSIPAINMAFKEDLRRRNIPFKPGSNVAVLHVWFANFRRSNRRRSSSRSDSAYASDD